MKPWYKNSSQLVFRAKKSFKNYKIYLESKQLGNLECLINNTFKLITNNNHNSCRQQSRFQKILEINIFNNCWTPYYLSLLPLKLNHLCRLMIYSLKTYSKINNYSLIMQTKFVNVSIIYCQVFLQIETTTLHNLFNFSQLL